MPNSSKKPAQHGVSSSPAIDIQDYIKAIIHSRTGTIILPRKSFGLDGTKQLFNEILQSERVTPIGIKLSLETHELDADARAMLDKIQKKHPGLTVMTNNGGSLRQQTVRRPLFIEEVGSHNSDKPGLRKDPMDSERENQPPTAGHVSPIIQNPC